MTDAARAKLTADAVTKANRCRTREPNQMCIECSIELAAAHTAEQTAALRAENERLRRFLDFVARTWITSKHLTCDPSCIHRKIEDDRFSELDAILADHEGQRAGEEWRDARALVEEQAKDPGLWFIAKTAPEGYLQQELRRLHAAVERARL